MAGGTGTRFWPVSKAGKPKQFLDVADTGKTFIRQTYERFLKTVPQDNIIIVTADRYRDLMLEQIPEIKSENLLTEPYSRNTAPCIAYATYTLLKRDPEAHVVVAPADHIIDDEDLFAETIRKAFDYVYENDVLMTLGVVPTRPDTNYGYIQAYGGSKAYRNNQPLQVKTFTEKPDKEMASLFISTGEFLWNAGIFLWKAATIRREMERYLPEVTGQFTGWESAIGTRIESEFIARAYTGCLNISIDYGVMEKTDMAWIYPVNFGWQDVGSWESLYNYIPKDNLGNAITAEKTLLESTGNMLVVSPEKKKLIAIKGLEDYMVIDTDDVLVICPKDDKKFKDFISGIAMPEYEKYR
ncbi:MAG: mannose-1-phosphate guanylyltransferase [Bacteroidales bacterium]|nr:mannose-1-phosphate guanylyltransferase [Bacteroidales bacterium]